MAQQQLDILRVASDRGIHWLQRGWRIFMANPGMWLLYMIVIIGINLVCAVVPLVGGLLAAFVNTIIGAGAVLIAARIERNEPHDVAVLFSGFTNETVRPQMLTLGALAAGAQLVVFIAALVLLGGHIATAMITGSMSAGTFAGGFIISLLLVLACAALVAMAFIYASPLVLMYEVPAIEAIKLSWRISVVNFVPMLVAGIIFGVLGVLASVLLIVGWLVLGPVTIGAIYASFTDTLRPLGELELGPAHAD
ncbi:MAG: hypothetical protein H6978_03340 [Gammaproteobacteria bacterium]|nr:hypothetical protein [Gammaproteobacteria bacterium]